ncbi:unnamed protein product [Prunus armeniaca]|uniref:Uncharacterized protein n=1 Tax=Prunus armeniaca TaxID=36596 RepID=A0A6J5UGD8_PRUAR|nr:unnamed protein product [Prunus armeniaca]CAB4305779.1 unnamed protein product [Prunus armeniaca]
MEKICGPWPRVRLRHPSCLVVSVGRLRIAMGRGSRGSFICGFAIGAVVDLHNAGLSSQFPFIGYVKLPSGAIHY